LFIGGAASPNGERTKDACQLTGNIGGVPLWPAFNFAESCSGVGTDLDVTIIPF
jgi:hypothetical protein